MAANLVDPRVAPAARPWVTGALALGAVVSAGWILLIAGEILSDPGGWVGAAWTAAWLVPSLGLAVVALVWPRIAYPVLVIATGVVSAAAFGANDRFQFAGGLIDFIIHHNIVKAMALSHFIACILQTQRNNIIFIRAAVPQPCLKHLQGRGHQKHGHHVVAQFFQAFHTLHVQLEDYILAGRQASVQFTIKCTV